MASVEVRVFANLRQSVNPDVAPDPDNPFQVDIRDGEVLGGLLDILGIPKDTIIIGLVNGVRQSMDYILKDGDRVGFFPPMGGG
ncbi:MAG: sulfur-carrier protein [Clostridia bacterium]|nr:hypothetical protein [Clostridiales bacterium]MDK2984607.1 sulfur-carrier protein [Clostridia bacterium]